jgi:L-malate glycosyltransferase
VRRRGASSDPIRCAKPLKNLASKSRALLATQGIGAARFRAVVLQSLPAATLAGLLLILQRGVRRKVRSIAPDVICGQYVTSAGLWTLVLRRPIALAAWGSDILIDCRRSRVVRALARAVLRRSDIVTYDSDNVRAALGDLVVPDSRLVRFDFGVDQDEIESSFLPPTQRPPVVVGLRSLDRDVYRVCEAITAFSSVAKRVPDTELIVGNDGSLRPELERLVAELGIRQHVRFIGTVANSKVVELLRSARVYVIPASDGTSATLLEALAAGCFPVVSDLPANREWIADGMMGRVVDGAQPGAVSDAIVDGLCRDDLDTVAEKNREMIRKRGVFEDHVRDLMARLGRVT